MTNKNKLLLNNLLNFHCTHDKSKYHKKYLVLATLFKFIGHFYTNNILKTLNVIIHLKAFNVRM